MDPPPLPFQLQDPERLRRELTRAGLRNVSVEQVHEPLSFGSGPEMWDWLVNSNPIVGDVLDGLALGKPKTPVVVAALDRMLRERAGGSGPPRLTNAINIGVGTK